MPDTWTYNPPMLREAIVASGIPCGREPRVLKSREPYWTCHVDESAWAGDIYIHHAKDLAPFPADDTLLLFAATLLLGFLIGKRSASSA